MVTKKTARTKKKEKENSVNWEGAYDDEFHLRRSLGHLQEKINRMGELIPRLAIDSPDLTPETLLTRMKERKKKLLQKVTSVERKTKKRHWSGAVLRPQAIGGLMDWWREKPPPGGKPGIEPSCFYGSGHSHARTLVWDAYEESWINHDSSKLYGVDSQYWDEHATILFSGKLNDDASLIRDDNPDWVEWGTEVRFYMQRPNCDATITVDLSIRLLSGFTNAADDGGSCFHSIAFAHTDPMGHWPDSVYVPSVQEIIVEFTGNDSYDSGWRNYSIRFDVRKGRRPRIAVLFITHLSAQDGTVTAVGQWNHSHAANYQFSPA